MINRRSITTTPHEQCWNSLIGFTNTTSTLGTYVYTIYYSYENTIFFSPPSCLRARRDQVWTAVADGSSAGELKGES